MSKDIHDPAAVTAFIKGLDVDFAKVIEAIRKLILASGKEIGEQIKWNSPAFFYTGPMKPFNPKEYKRDIVVVNVRKGVALLVFPTGAIIDDKEHMLEGDYKDGRRMMTFKDMKDVKAKGNGLQRVIQSWLSKVDKA